MSVSCAHCTLDPDQCLRCDREVRLRDLEGHEGRHGLYDLLVAHGGQSHE